MYPTTFPGITFQGVYIHEPGGLITDLLIALVSLILVIRLGRPNDLFDKYWTLFIAMIGMGAAGGVLVHGIPTVLGPTLFYIIWVLKNIFIPVGNFFASYIILATLFPEKIKLIKTVFWLKAILATAAMMIWYSFTPIVVDLGITYILVIWMSNRLKRELHEYRIIQNAFLIAFFSGFLFLFKVDIDPVWFSHKDVVHIFVIWSIWLIYRAIRKNTLKYAMPPIIKY